MAKNPPPKEDTWAFQHIGSPFPDNPVKAVGQQNMYVALWSKHGKSIHGRAWNNGGVVECSFPYSTFELTDIKDVGGEIHILQYKGDHNTLGYWYEWIKFKDRAVKPGERQLVKCGDSLPILWKDRKDGAIVGDVDPVLQEARFSHDGIAEKLSGDALSDIARVHQLITPHLIGSKVISIHVYGSSFLDQNESVNTGGFSSREPGPCQLAVAMKMRDRYAADFVNISLFAQEPQYMEAEEDFLRDNNILCSTNETFNKELLGHIADLDSPNIQAKAIVFMICPAPNMLPAFIHTNFDILDRIIFISYKPDFVASKHSRGEYYHQILNDYAALCEPPVELSFNAGTLGRQVYGERESWVYTITKKNADMFRRRYQY
uniref:SRR1-like domain-containing protein n=1 Tax=Panagrolaimus davidi TaxID=227884 RepID=A0A914R1E4_9BILA